MYGSSMSTPRISERRTYRRNLFTAAEGKKGDRLCVVYVLHARTGDKQGHRFWPTEARLLVGRELHEVWAGAERSAVVIDETQM